MQDATLIGIDLGKHGFHMHGQNRHGKAAAVGARPRGQTHLPPQFVKPFVKGNKNDFIDAEAICEEPAARRCVS